MSEQEIPEGQSMLEGAGEAVGAAFAQLVEFVMYLVLQVVRVILLLLPVALRLACVGAEVAAAWLTFPRVYAAFGCDPTSAMLAGVVVVAPAAFTLANGLSWGGLLVSALATWVAGEIVQRLDIASRALAVAGVLGAVVVHFVSRKEKDDEPQERGYSASGDWCGTDGLHDVP